MRETGRVVSTSSVDIDWALLLALAAEVGPVYHGTVVKDALRRQSDGDKACGDDDRTQQSMHHEETCLQSRQWRTQNRHYARPG